MYTRQLWSSIRLDRNQLDQVDGIKLADTIGKNSKKLYHF